MKLKILPKLNCRGIVEDIPKIENKSIVQD
jgi:hypothetical protein